MRQPKDLAEAAATVAHHLGPPFAVYSVGAQQGKLHIDVPVEEVAMAEAYFESHPIELADGTRVAVSVEGIRGGSWVTYPVRGPEKHPAPLQGAGVEVGLPVEEAARRANAAGWLVRAYEPRAGLTLDLRMNRVNLRYDAGGEVTDVSTG